MKIIAKKDSALEQTLKQMCEKMTEGVIGAQNLVEKIAGVRPEDIYHLYHWGIISKLTPEFVFNAKDVGHINPKYLREKKGAKDVWVPAARYKEGKQLDADFRKFADEHEIREDELNGYGIHLVHWKKGISYYCQLAHDSENERYMLVCSNSIPEAFDKKTLAKEQFDLEY